MALDQVKAEINKFIDAEQYQEALNLVDKLLKETPDDIDLLSAKVFIFGQQGHYEESIEVADLALRKGSTDCYLWYKRGVSLYHLKKYTEALESFEKKFNNKSRMYRSIPMFFLLRIIMTYYHLKRL